MNSQKKKKRTGLSPTNVGYKRLEAKILSSFFRSIAINSRGYGCVCRGQIAVIARQNTVVVK